MSYEPCELRLNSNPGMTHGFDVLPLKTNTVTLSPAAGQTRASIRDQMAIRSGTCDCGDLASSADARSLSLIPLTQA